MARSTWSYLALILYPFLGNSDVVIDEMEEFLTGSRTEPDGDVVVATVLFTDIVDSTRQSAALYTAPVQPSQDHDARVGTCWINIAVAVDEDDGPRVPRYV